MTDRDTIGRSLLLAFGGVVVAILSAAFTSGQPGAFGPPAVAVGVAVPLAGAVAVVVARDRLRTDAWLWSWPEEWSISRRFGVSLVVSFVVTFTVQLAIRALPEPVVVGVLSAFVVGGLTVAVLGVVAAAATALGVVHRTDTRERAS